MMTLRLQLSRARFFVFFFRALVSFFFSRGSVASLSSLRLPGGCEFLGALRVWGWVGGRVCVCVCVCVYIYI